MMRREWKAGLLAVALAAPLHASAKEQQPWFDPSLPTEQRVNALIEEMTLTEKASASRPNHGPGAR